MTVIFVDCNKHLERDPGRDRRQHGYVEFHGKSRREFHLDKVAKLLEVLELRRDYLRKMENVKYGVSSTNYTDVSQLVAYHINQMHLVKPPSFHHKTPTHFQDVQQHRDGEGELLAHGDGGLECLGGLLEDGLPA